MPDYHEALHATTVEMISHYSGIVKKETEGKVPAISDTALHEIYREAGVHLYSDAGVVLVD